MHKRRRSQLAIIVLILASTGLAARWFLSSERRRKAWAHEAITQIARLSADPSSIAGRAATLRDPPSPGSPPPGFWIANNLAVMHDGQWIVFKNECIHRQQLLGDIFIGKASNGRWYYSSFHFCCEMLVPTMDGQPPDLQTFMDKYHVREFNGDPNSKQAIEPTWAPGSTPIQ